MTGEQRLINIVERDARIGETNTLNDEEKVWGQSYDSKQGQNLLGKLLEKIRLDCQDPLVEITAWIENCQNLVTEEDRRAYPSI